MSFSRARRRSTGAAPSYVTDSWFVALKPYLSAAALKPWYPAGSQLPWVTGATPIKATFLPFGFSAEAALPPPPSPSLLLSLPHAARPRARVRTTRTNDQRLPIGCTDLPSTVLD